MAEMTLAETIPPHARRRRQTFSTRRMRRCHRCRAWWSSHPRGARLSASRGQRLRLPRLGVRWAGLAS